MNTLSKHCIALVATACLMACGGSDTPNNSGAAVIPTQKTATTDPFKNTMVPTQDFTINGNDNATVEGAQGSVIVMPKGCFVNAKGEEVLSEVKVQLAEALTLADMMLSNLTTTANGKLLETGGMLYVNATTPAGEQLGINPKKPIYVEVPTPRKKPGMMLYKGVRDSLGNMDWREPVSLENFLVTVPLADLDFLPPGFTLEVAKSLPIKKNKYLTHKLVDSLYLSLHGTTSWDFMQRITDFTNFSIGNEPLLNEATTNNYVNSSDTIGLFVTGATFSVQNRDYAAHGEDTHAKDTVSYCGIDPAIIKVLKSSKYEGTLIATREFEARLKVLFKTCQSGIIELYINNLDKNMYEIDSMAAIKLQGSGYADEFIRFKNLRQGRVKNGSEHAALLKNFYKTRLTEVTTKLDAARKKYEDELKKASDDFNGVRAEYTQLLVKREKYRMETYGFRMTQTGWVNVDRGTVEKWWDFWNMEFTLTNGKTYDRAYTYLIFKQIKSLVRLNTQEQEIHYTGTVNDRRMYMPKNQPALAIAVAYKGGQLYFTLAEFATQDGKRLTLNPVAATKAELLKALAPFEDYVTENSVTKELDYMEKFYKEKQPLKKVADENALMLKLYNKAFPCCAINVPAPSPHAPAEFNY